MRAVRIYWGGVILCVGILALLFSENERSWVIGGVLLLIIGAVTFGSAINNRRTTTDNDPPQFN